ncbi:MAG: nitroreductase [Candidatus Azotimanducaceae bacterium]|jgi:nitroreductase
MNVSEAIAKRKSIRAFSDKKVDKELIRSLLEKAARSPSGGNVQPWRIYVLCGSTMYDFKDFLATHTEPESPEYAIYPEALSEPYRSNRFKVGEDMYKLLNIPREDKAGRFARLMENYNFFGAPAAFFCFVDRQMGPPQWSDLGMFLQSFMLLATEQGLGTCSQEAWAMRPKAVSKFVSSPDELMLFCGMAIGYAEETAVNTLSTDRTHVDEFATFIE